MKEFLIYSLYLIIQFRSNHKEVISFSIENINIVHLKADLGSEESNNDDNQIRFRDYSNINVNKFNAISKYILNIWFYYEDNIYIEVEDIS